MEKKTRYTLLGWPILFLLLIITAGDLYAKSMQSAYPPPEVWDQVIHSKGNIATTVDNFGLIGGYWNTTLPSGEWPRNTGHNYIGEIKFWMGAITPASDTIVADTDDDFQPLPSLVSGTETYGIRISTDPESYEYDLADTVGLGIGYPAYGWRVWNSDSAAWVYNQIYSPADQDFFPGGPTALQQSFYRFDDALTPTNLGLDVSQTIFQWNYCYNEDLLFVVLEITNSSAIDYTEFAFAIYCDIDVGGPDGTGENGRLGDLVAFDQVENLAWTYDEDGYDPGWGPLVRTGIMGTKYLETPDGIGMTAFRTGQWEQVWNIDDPAKFELIDSEQFDTSLPPTDQYYLQCTRGINLTAGKTVRVVFAIIAGEDEEEFYANAATAQTLYDNYFVGPQPPASPILEVQAGDGKVYLRWSDTSEVSVDPLTKETDFRGYKLYRSDNQGYTWGFEADFDDQCLQVDYYPIAAYQVMEAGNPISHSYIDSDLNNGVEYWYCLVAYDEGDPTVPIGPLQNGFGRPDVDPNVVRVVPRSDPAGYFDAFSTLEHVYSGNGEPSDGELYPIRFDENAVQGPDYKVIFTETDLQTFWHLIDVTSDDTVLVDQTLQSQTADPGEFPIGDGIRVVVRNGDCIPRSMGQTAFGVPDDTTITMFDFLGPFGDVFDMPVGGDKHFRSTYELRFTAGGSQGYQIFDHTSIIPLPFEVWNTTLDYQVHAEIYDWDGDLVWNPEVGDYISIVNVPYDGLPHPEAFPFNHAWFFAVDPYNTQYNTGDIYTIEGAPLNGSDDVFTFTADGIVSSAAASAMDLIRVVPDPYIAHTPLETDQYNRKLQFINLPDECTVRIYTLSGDLVKTLDHSGAGTADWNMLTESGLGIVSGVYLYHVESPYGDRIGRFAVIK
ncbi:MAG: hypothetical protein JSV44_00105 [Candidatus Zixiibacteriota bacterium]|nr:MAG: hypothetical protein JSV44_00105 [candidate division Zixibacteria bacterium]